jgi:hypothetical protein
VFAIIPVILLVLSLSTENVSASNATLNITLATGRHGGFGGLNIVEQGYPFTVHFATNVSSAASYLWQFGDGTNSTSPSPAHAYKEACIYNVSVAVTAANGSSVYGYLSLGMFDRVGQPHDLELCPPQGTAGFIPVELDGGFFPKREKVNVLMNGTSIDNVTTNSYGTFDLSVNSSLPPEVNGTKYVFRTEPSSLTRVFTTLEGIRGSPQSGPPGVSVTIKGRSYPADSSVSLALGNVSLGTEQTYGNGSFLAVVTIPNVYPLTRAGTYNYTTGPPILGTHADFMSTGSGPNMIPPLSSTLWWWILLIILIVAAFLLVWLVAGRRRRRPEERGAPTPRI